MAYHHRPRKEIKKDYNIARLFPIQLSDGYSCGIGLNKENMDETNHPLTPLKNTIKPLKLDYSDTSKEWCEDKMVELLQLIVDHREENSFIIPNDLLLSDRRSHQGICNALKEYQLVKEAVSMKEGIECIIL